MKYYAIYNTKTEELSKAQCRCLNTECINLEVSKDVYDNLEKYIVVDDELVLNPNYEAEQETKRQQEIAMLSLTAADVERGIYKATGKDFDDIVALVTEVQPQGIDVKALKIELKANHFYRGNPYVNAVGALLGFTSEQLDKFFETNDYTHLLPPVVEDEIIKEDVEVEND